GQTAHGDVDDAEVEQHLGGRVALRCAAVDDDQLRRVGELARPPGRRVDAGPARVDLAVGRGGDLVQLDLGVEVAREPATQHLGQRGDVVGRAVDREPAIFALAGQPVLKDDHAGDNVGALDLGNVVTLDAQRC